jgi:hypothetical protein
MTKCRFSFFFFFTLEEYARFIFPFSIFNESNLKGNCNLQEAKVFKYSQIYLILPTPKAFDLVFTNYNIACAKVWKSTPQLFTKNFFPKKKKNRARKHQIVIR